MNRKYVMGAIWSVPDTKITFPFNLFRKPHPHRLVVIVENSACNFDKNQDTIMIAPLSSQTLQHSPYDILITKNDTNNLIKDSYIRMRAIQFICKSDLDKYVGKISDDIKCRIIATIEDYIGQ